MKAKAATHAIEATTKAENEKAESKQKADAIVL
jgi:hypothetical protein